MTGVSPTTRFDSPRLKRSGFSTTVFSRNSSIPAWHFLANLRALAQPSWFVVMPGDSCCSRPKSFSACNSCQVS